MSQFKRQLLLLCERPSYITDFWLNELLYLKFQVDDNDDFRFYLEMNQRKRSHLAQLSTFIESKFISQFQ